MRHRLPSLEVLTAQCQGSGMKLLVEILSGSTGGARGELGGAGAVGFSFAMVVHGEGDGPSASVVRRGRFNVRHLLIVVNGSLPPPRRRSSVHFGAFPLSMGRFLRYRARNHMRSCNTTVSPGARRTPGGGQPPWGCSSPRGGDFSLDNRLHFPHAGVGQAIRRRRRMPAGLLPCIVGPSFLPPTVLS